MPPFEPLENLFGLLASAGDDLGELFEQGLGHAIGQSKKRSAMKAKLYTK